MIGTVAQVERTSWGWQIAIQIEAAETIRSGVPVELTLIQTAAGEAVRDSTPLRGILHVFMERVVVAEVRSSPTSAGARRLKQGDVVDLNTSDPRA